MLIISEIYIYLHNYLQIGDNMNLEKSLIKNGIAIALTAMPALAASDFDIKVLIGDPSKIWGKLDTQTQALIVFITGIGMLAAIVAAILSYEAHSMRGSAGETMDVQGSKNTAFHGMLRTTMYFLGMLFFIALIGIVFKLYG